MANRRRFVRLGIIGGLFATFVMGPGTGGARLMAPEDAKPDLGVVSGARTVYAYRERGQRYAFLALSASVVAGGNPLEVRLRRPGRYSDPVVVEEVLHDTDPPSVHPVAIENDGIYGLRNFLEIVVRGEAGHVRYSEQLDFCPDGWALERYNDAGPDDPERSPGCGYNPFARGARISVPTGWAAGVFAGAALDLPNGEYRLRVRIARPWAEALDRRLGNEYSDMLLVIRTGRQPCDFGCGEGSTSLAPLGVDPPLPDLIPLPAFGINLRRQRGRTWLAFGATVYNGGESPLVVEGFRRRGHRVMHAYQYFYLDGVRVDRAPVGEMEYDRRPTHEHWHFKDFAHYSLTDANRNEIRSSGKESFCLAPTDAIDLSLLHAEQDPYQVGLDGACGYKTSLWTRQILQVGWGDTYEQYRAGQALDITGLAAGTYYIKVDTNPDGRLRESSNTNNISYRKIVVRRPRGRIEITMPPYQGIDTDPGIHCEPGDCGPTTTTTAHR